MDDSKGSKGLEAGSKDGDNDDDDSRSDRVLMYPRDDQRAAATMIMMIAILRNQQVATMTMKTGMAQRDQRCQRFR